MKITTLRGKIINVSIRKVGGNISFMSEDAAGSGIQGQVVQATKHEINLLKSAPPTGITVSDDLVPSDENGV